MFCISMKWFYDFILQFSIHLKKFVFHNQSVPRWWAISWIGYELFSNSFKRFQFWNVLKKKIITLCDFQGFNLSQHAKKFRTLVWLHNAISNGGNLNYQVQKPNKSRYSLKSVAQFTWSKNEPTSSAFTSDYLRNVKKICQHVTYVLEINK